MKVSTKGRYGVRFMVDLAIHGNNGLVTLKEVAKRQGISEKYLWQVAAPLKAAGLVSAAVGLKGGYSLARPASEITLKDVLDILEGGSALVDCVSCPEGCDRHGDCVAREMWVELSNKINRAMEEIKLSQMVEKEKERSSKQAQNYTI